MPAAHEPQPGAAVRLLPKDEGAERPGTLVAWSVGPAGIIATADIEVSEVDGWALGGVPLWASIQGEPAADGTPGPVVVLEGTPTPLPGGGALTLTGALALATEPRRAALRAATEVSVAVDGGAAATIDLSRTGARISLPSSALPTSARVAVDLGLGGEEIITTDAEVVRVDSARGEIAVRFTGLADADAVRIDRAVLAALSEQA